MKLKFNVFPVVTRGVKKPFPVSKISHTWLNGSHWWLELKVTGNKDLVAHYPVFVCLIPVEKRRQVKEVTEKYYS